MSSVYRFKDPVPSPPSFEEEEIEDIPSTPIQPTRRRITILHPPRKPAAVNKPSMHTCDIVMLDLILYQVSTGSLTMLLRTVKMKTALLLSALQHLHNLSSYPLTAYQSKK